MPLPSLEVLSMQWILQRILVLIATAEPEGDGEDEDEDKTAVLVDDRASSLEDSFQASPILPKDQLPHRLDLQTPPKERAILKSRHSPQVSDQSLLASKITTNFSYRQFFTLR